MFLKTEKNDVFYEMRDLFRKWENIVISFEQTHFNQLITSSLNMAHNKIHTGITIKKNTDIIIIIFN